MAGVDAAKPRVLVTLLQLLDEVVHELVLDIGVLEAISL